MLRDQYQVDDDIFPMIQVIRNDLIEEYQRLSAQGYRGTRRRVSRVCQGQDDVLDH